MTLTPGKIQALNAKLESECPICQCQMIAPTAIPACGHKFCFTCLKGVCMSTCICPMCRGPIDVKIFNLPSQVLNLKMDIPVSPVILAVKKPSTTGEDDNESSAPMPLDLDATLDDEPVKEEKHYWLYRGTHQGWWRFDPRHERDIEEAFNGGCLHYELLICGKPYIIDFTSGVQFLKSNPNQARSVKRVTAGDFDKMGVKGLAGVFVPTV